MENIDRNCLSYWFPKLEAAGLPVPKTRIIHAGPNWRNLSRTLDGESTIVLQSLVAGISAAVAEVGGYPFFLRTGHGSGKHNWSRTCCVAEPGDIGSHVAALVEWSEMDMFGDLKYDVWAVRELLPTTPVCKLPSYREMPLCPEFRCFVRDAEVLCCHSYWPWESVVQGFPFKAGKEWDDEHEVPTEMRGKWEHISSLEPDDAEAVRNLASQAGEAVGGEWSVDILDTQRGWYVTDMAEAARSWHWPGCPHGVENRG